ncbi:MAG TPA: AAA family ATPase, partial [Halothiobacillus sp.]|nr:AAA family ATPase [Halothiobacillus sp.]
GSMQHAFVLTGSDTHWGNSQSGEIFKMIGHSKSACGVIVLDEVDKISDRSDYAVLPALLDILEPESSKNFMDVSLGLTFDASRLFFILTCNDKGKLDPALLSRCLAFDIAAPGFEQKVMIAKGEHDNINKGLPRCRHLALDIQAVEKLAQANIDVRALIRAVRKGFTVAYTNGFKVAVPVLDAVTEVKKSRPIGFVWPELGMQNPPPKTDGGTLYCIGRAVNY